MKRSKQDVEKLKTDILDTAQEIFMIKNYSDTNIKDITDRLGVTRTPVYYHFNNKYEIYQQVAYRYLEEKLDTFRDILEGDKSFFEKVRLDLIVCTQQAVCENVLFSEIGSNPELAEILKRRQEVSEIIYGYKLDSIAMAKEQGELRKDADEEELTGKLYLLHYGVIEMKKCIFHDFTPQLVERLVEQHIEDLRRNYGAEGE